MTQAKRNIYSTTRTFLQSQSFTIALIPHQIVRAEIPRLGIVKRIVCLLSPGLGTLAPIRPRRLRLEITRASYFFDMSWEAHRLRRLDLLWRQEQNAVLLFTATDLPFDLNLLHQGIVEVVADSGEGTLEVLHEQEVTMA